MKKICIWGTSVKKVADEAQMLSVINSVIRKQPSSEITIFAQNGEILKRYNITCVRTFPARRVLNVISELFRCDLFIIVGGPFMEYSKQMMSCSFLILLCKFFNKPIVTYGTSLFGYKTSIGNKLFKFLFNRIDRITVREEVCLNILSNLGVAKRTYLYPDPRYTLNPSNKADIIEILINENIDINKEIIGISTRHLHENIPDWVKRSHGFTETLAMNVYEVLGKTISGDRNSYQYVLIPMHPSYQDDLKTCDKIKKYMADTGKLKILSKQYRSLDLLGIIKACKLIISCRLGSSIFASATSTPHISIAYESRMIDHMQSIGLNDYVFEWKKLQYENFYPKFNEVLCKNDEIKQKLSVCVDDLRTKALQNIDVIDDLI